MPEEFRRYLFQQLKKHIDRLKETAMADSPDVDIIDYHAAEAEEIVAKLEGGLQE